MSVCYGVKCRLVLIIGFGLGPLPWLDVQVKQGI